MKLKSLLLTAAAVALTAGQASAYEINPINPVGGITPALELAISDPANTSATPIVGNFIFNVDLEGVGASLPSGDNIAVRIDLPSNVSFNVAASPLSILPGADGVAPAGVTLQAGGGVGDDFVEYLYAVDSDNNLDDMSIGFDFDLQLSSCATDGTFRAVLQLAGTASPVFIEGDPFAESTDVISPCESAKDGVVTSDEAGPGPVDNTVILLPDYVDLNDGTLGAVNYTIDPNIAIDLAGTPFEAQDVASITFDVQFADVTGIDTLTVGGLPATLVPADNLFRVVANSPADVALLTDGIADDIVITTTGTAEITAQTVSITNAVCSFVQGATARADFIVSEMGAEGGLDTLQREGQVFGFFDWNAEAGPVNTVYRVTGLSTTEDTPLTVVYENSNAGENGSFEMVIAAADVNNGEYIITSRTQLADLNPGYDRADIQFNFETTNGLDVDRLISSNGIVTDYGDGANGTTFDNVNPGDSFPSVDGDNDALGTGVVTE